MKSEINAMLIYLFSYIYFPYAESNTSYYVTIIANNTQDPQSTTSKTFEDYIKYKNISIQTRAISLPRSSGLSEVISTAPSLLSQNFTTKHGKEVFHLSQVGEKMRNILKEISWKRKLTSNDITKCSQMLEEKINTYSSCGKYKTIYADVLAILIYRTFAQPVMFVVDRDSCSNQFASMLKNFTYDNTGNYQEPFFHFVNDSFNIFSDLSQMFYKATIESVTTIILLCSDSLSDLIFRRARSSSISYSNVLWVGIEYSSTINNTLAPPLLLSISLKLDTDAVSAALNENAGKILATKAVASLAVKRTIISKLDAIKLVRQLLETAPRPTCITNNANVPSVLVSLKQPQHTWMPIYIVSSDRTLSQLVDDKKVSWLSRQNTHKAKVIVTTMQEEPFVTTLKQYYNAYTKECSQGVKCRVPKKSNNGTVWEASCCLGSIMELLKMLQKDLWLAIDLHVAEDGFFGSIVNGTWNGMIGELVTGKADMAFASLTLTTKRSTAVDFGESFMHVTLGILVASNYVDEMKLFNFNFVSNVAGNLLLALLGIFTCGLIVLYAAENIVNHQRGQQGKYAFKESLSYLSGITFQRDLSGKNPQQYATRVIFIIFAFGMVIVMTTYTATLTAVKVKKDNNLVLTGIQDPKLRNPTDAFKFAAMKSSSVEQYFKFSESPAYQRMDSFMGKYNTDTNKIGAQKVMSGELQAFIAEYSVLQYQVSQQKDCQLRAIKTTNGQSSWNVAFRKNSPWKNIISKKILEYKETGLFDSIMTKWTQTKCMSQGAVHPTSQKYRIAHFSGLVILLVCTMIFSIIVLVVECLVSKRIEKCSDFSLDSE